MKDVIEELLVIGSLALLLVIIIAVIGYAYTSSNATDECLSRNYTSSKTTINMKTYCINEYQGAVISLDDLQEAEQD